MFCVSERERGVRCNGERERLLRHTNVVLSSSFPFKWKCHKLYKCLGSPCLYSLSSDFTIRFFSFIFFSFMTFLLFSFFLSRSIISFEKIVKGSMINNSWKWKCVLIINDRITRLLKHHGVSVVLWYCLLCSKIIYTINKCLVLTRDLFSPNIFAFYRINNFTMNAYG